MEPREINARLAAPATISCSLPTVILVSSDSFCTATIAVSTLVMLAGAHLPSMFLLYKISPWVSSYTTALRALIDALNGFFTHEYEAPLPVVSGGMVTLGLVVWFTGWGAAVAAAARVVFGCAAVVSVSAAVVDSVASVVSSVSVVEVVIVVLVVVSAVVSVSAAAPVVVVVTGASTGLASLPQPTQPINMAAAMIPAIHFLIVFSP